jgi:5-methylcytosine-specific restriction enzyme A
MAVWPYTTQRWQRIRRLKLATNPLCEICLKQGRIEPAVAVDHIVPIKSGGPPYPDLDALQSLCTSCHNHKTNCEREGKAVFAKGCDIRGYPLDPNHPWYKT